MASKPPAAPDPVVTAQAQGAVNRDTAITQYLLNATDQVTPFGSLTYEPIGNWSDNPQLNPLAQGGGPSAALAPAAASTRGTSTYAGPDYSTGKSSMNVSPAGGGFSSSGGTQAAATMANTATAGALGQGYLNTPRFRAVQTLNPQLQTTVDNYLGTAAGLSGTVRDTLGQQLDTSGLPARAGNLSGSTGLQTELGLQNSINSDRVSLANVPVNASWKGPQARYTIDNAGAIQKDIGPDDFSADRQRVEEALLSRVNPSFERDRANLESNLRARGIGVGTVAYDRAMDELNRSATDSRYQAVLAGGQEQSRLSGLELAQGNFRNAAQAQQYGQNANDAAFFNSAQGQNFNQSMARDQFAREGINLNNNTSLAQVGFNNDARMSDAQFGNNALLQGASFRNQAQNQGFNQDLAAAQFNNTNRSSALEEQAFLRSLPLNEINALLQGTQLAGPKFTNTPTPGVAGVDYTGLVQSNYQNQVAAANQKNSNLFGGIASLGSGLAGLFSDRRLKRDIIPIKATLGGFPLYAYRYLGSETLSFGVMADEVEAAMPDVIVERDGFKAVRYDMLEAA